MKTDRDPRGAISILDPAKRRKLGDLLLAIREGVETPEFTHYMKHVLEAGGFITFKQVRTGMRGRPALELKLTEKGQKLASYSKKRRVI